MSRIRVMLVDDHDMVRRGLETILSLHEDMEVVGEACDGEEALLKYKQSDPDVTLMDLIMPRLDGIETIQAILAEDPSAKIIALTSFKEQDLVKRALDAGAISYLLKNTTGDQLVEAIRDAHQGEPTLAPEATKVLIAAATAPPSVGHDLTEREQEVLMLLSEGLTNRQIAERLGVQSSTVKNHVSSILAKLQAASRTEAAAIAIKRDLV